MPFLDITAARIAFTTVLTASGYDYYHWYCDGSWVGMTTDGRFSISLDYGEESCLDCFGTDDPDWDPIAGAPAGWPARRTLFWTAPADSDIDHYIVRQKKDAGAWADLATVDHDGSWTYAFLTARLTDLSDYTWRVVPVDAAGNEGTVKEIGPETVVRKPDSPAFAMTFDPGTDKVTFDVT